MQTQSYNFKPNFYLSFLADLNPIDENELIDGKTPEIWYGEFRGKVCKRTSYNSRRGKRVNPLTNNIIDEPGFRKNYAGIGFFYDQERDAFIPPKSYNSWILNEDTCWWESPIPYPKDGKIYDWSEESQQWEEIIE